MEPFLSIIIPLYNKQHHILKTLNSILSQECENIEIIIVDDGSTDNSVNVVNGINDKRFRLFCKQNGGPSSARNYGVKMAKGAWVLFLDADDTLEKKAISNLYELAQTHSKCNVICCNHYINDGHGEKIYSNNYKEGIVRNPFFDWCRGRLMPRAGAAIFLREILKTHPFQEQLHRYEDAENLFSIMREGHIFRSPIPIMTYYSSSASASLPCKNINDDFIGHLSPKGKSFWEQYALYQLYLQGCNIYPKEMDQLYGSIFDKMKYKIADYFMNQNSYNKQPILLHIKRYIKNGIRKIATKSMPELNYLYNHGNKYNLVSWTDKTTIGKNVLLYPLYHISESSIGDYTYIAQNSFISMTTIGKFCSIGPNLVCGWGIHPTNGISTSPMFYSTRKQNGTTLSVIDKVEERKPIKIGNDVFIGANVTILDGVTIGDGAVIGAGAVVSKDIPPYAIAVGCPIEIKRYRFPSKQISALQKIKWWDCNEEMLKEVERHFFDVEKFINGTSK